MAKDASLSSLLTDSSGAVDSVGPEKGKQDDMAYWPTITTKDQIPGWLRDNDYIVGGHPMPTYSYRRSFRLWRCLHMETMNIWTHLIGCLGFAITALALYIPVVQRVYWGLNLFSALAAAVVLFDSGGGGSKMRTLRGGVFTLLALSALLPFFHTASLMGWSRARDEIGAVWYLAEGMSLLLGVGLFVSRVPERLKPGSFDILGHSHQLFHICAVIGGAFHVAALVVVYNYRRMHPSC